jgi:Lactoylglutathione lyase and related lyases
VSATDAIDADHTGITVSNLDRALDFWQNVLGFEFSHTAHQAGRMAEEITGVSGAEIKLAVVKRRADTKSNCSSISPRPIENASIFGHATSDQFTSHLRSIISTLLSTIARAGWKAAGKPQTLTVGPNAGKRVIYVRDPDRTTIEFMETPKRVDG